MKIDKRRITISLIFGFIFGLIMAIGKYYFKNEFKVVFTDLHLYLNIIIATIIFTVFLMLLFKYLPKIKKILEKIRLPSFLEKLIGNANIKTFIFVFILIMILWIPTFLAVYPGYLCYDALSQLYQYEAGNFEAWQPVIHTVILGGFINLGHSLFGSYSIGLTIYCIVQALLIICTFSYLVVFLAKRKVPPYILLITIILFAINPIVEILSFSTIKVTFFVCFYLFWLMFLIEMLENPEKYFSKKRNIVKFIIVAILMSLFRKQGIYIYIVLIPILFVFLTKYWKKILIMYGSVIVVVFAFFNPISNLLGIKKSPPAEALSVPIQQISAVVNKNRESITEEEWNIITRYFDEEIFKDYKPQIADPVKSKFNNKEFEKDKISFIKLWVELGLKNKQIYMNALIDLDIGYVYPSVRTISDWSVICPYNSQNSYDIKLNSLFEPYYEYLQYASNDFFKEWPIVSLFVCEAMPTWVILITLSILIYKKKYKLMVPLIGLLLYLGTCLLAPVCCIRYIYPLLVSLVLVIALPFIKGGNKYENSSINTMLQ